MQIDFFEAELLKARQRFNETFGRLSVCNLGYRYAAIMAVAWLGVLSRKISGARDKDSVRKEIQEFVEKRNTLNKLFSMVEREIKERRCLTIKGHERPAHGKNEEPAAANVQLSANHGKRAVS